MLPSARNGTATIPQQFYLSDFLPFAPAQHSQYNAQKPKFSVRWQPLDPKWIGALILRGSYSEAFHAPTLPELTPARVRGHRGVADPKKFDSPGLALGSGHH